MRAPSRRLLKPQTYGWLNEVKIAFFATMSVSPWGGSEELWFRTAQLALERGHQVAVVSFRWPAVPPKMRELQQRGAWLLSLARVQDWQHSAFRRWLHKLEFERFRVWGALASWKPDAVCVSQGGTYDMVYNGIFTNFLDEHGVPYIVICQHNYEDIDLAHESLRQIAFGYLSRARHVAFVSERNFRVAERQIAADLPNASVVRNPVNLASFSPVPHPKSAVVKMANVARFDARCKGQDVLLQALSGERWKERHWLLRFYGSGDDRSYLERLTAHYNLAGKVEFCGHVSDVRSIWADNHLLVMPSRSEGTPMALVEAMICGRPSVVTDVGGNIEWIDEPSTGFVAEAPSARSLNNALERAWESRQRWELIGQRAHEVAITKADPPPEEMVLSLLLQIEADTATEGRPNSVDKGISKIRKILANN
jgi:glycosyltransferase involved in cell wall biosynthesis